MTAEKIQENSSDTPTSPLILRGDTAAQIVRARVKETVEEYVQLHSRTPHLAVILSYDSPASKIYVAKKIEACREVGIRSTTITTPCTTTYALISLIYELNQNPDIDAILVQFPLAPGVDSFAATEAIDPCKDVDGFSPYNLGKLVQGNTDGLIPWTPRGIIRLLQHYSISPQGKNIVIVGRSMVVGKPLSLLFSSTSPSGNATVTVAHRHTTNLATLCHSADILIAAVGSPGLIQTSMMQKNAVVIDVGINRVIDEKTHKPKLVGDVLFSEEAHHISAITPVPRGVGPMTVACLLENTMLCAQLLVKK